MSKFDKIVEVYTSLSAMHAADQFRPVPQAKKDSVDIESPEITKQALDALETLRAKDPEMFNKFVSRLLQIANS